MQLAPTAFVVLAFVTEVNTTNKVTFIQHVNWRIFPPALQVSIVGFGPANEMSSEELSFPVADFRYDFSSIDLEASFQDTSCPLVLIKGQFQYNVFIDLIGEFHTWLL